MAQEYHKARDWRLARGLTVQRLAELTGYSIESIYAMERGKSTTPAGGRVKEWVWQRYKCACAGIEAQIRSGLNFDWGT